MGSSLRERAAKASKASGDKPTPKASAPAPTKAKPKAAEPKAEEPKAAEPKAKEEAPVSEPQPSPKADAATPSPEEIVSRLTPEQVNELLAQITAAEAKPLTAALKATRVTRKDDVQYDGRTPEGFVIRIWAPKGSPMLTEASVSGPDVS